MENNIFKKDEDGNTIYRFFGKNYIVNNLNTQRKLQDMEWYRKLIFSYRPMIFAPILILSFICSMIFSFITKNYKVKLIMASFMIFFYIIVCLLYYYIIRKILKEKSDEPQFK